MLARSLLLALVLLAGLPAAAQPAFSGLAPDEQVTIDAERLTWTDDGVVHAEGNVRVSAGNLRLAADRIVYDTHAGRVRLEGGLTAVDGSWVARAERGSFDLGTSAGLLEEVALWSKAEPPEPEETFALSRGELALLGQNELSVQAPEISRQPDGNWVAISPSLTTCDCDGDPPSWTMGASRATLVQGDRVDLLWPVLKAGGFPVAAFPFFSLPLSDRKTGFLTPEVQLFGRRGFSWEQPFFLVLGRSYDATFSAGYFFGSRREQRFRLPGAETDTVAEVDRAFRGPRVGAEFRYVPREGTVGRLYGAWAYDLSSRPPTRGSVVPGQRPAPDEPVQFPTDGPHRFFVQLDHVDDWSGGLSDRISLNLVSDRFYLRDFTDEVVLQSTGVLASSAWIAQREGPLLVALDGTYLQDLRLPYPARLTAGQQPSQVESSDLFGAGRRNTFARLPAFAFDLARLPLPLGAGLSLHAGAARFAPLTSTGFGDYGRDGLGPGDPRYPGPDEGEGDGILGPGERPATTRLALRPTLDLPIVAGRWLSLTPFVGWRQLLYFNDATDDGSVGYGVLGADAHTELARTFAEGRVRHAWIPRLQLRRLFAADGDEGPVRPYDELDVRPLESFTQARLALGTRVDVATPGGGVAALEAEAGQDFLLEPIAEPRESFASAQLALAPAALQGLLRWDTQSLELTEVSANASLTARQGHQLRLGYRNLARGGSARLRAGTDELFAPGYAEGRPLSSDLLDPASVAHIEQYTAGATVVPLEGFSLRYDLLLLATLDEDRLLEQRAGIGYQSPCGCWGAELRLLLRRDDDFPDVGIAVDLGGLVDF